MPLLSIVTIGLLSALLLGCQSMPSVHKRSQMLMGTMVFLTAAGPDDETSHAALEAGFQEIRRLEKLLSTWDAASELSAVNAAAGRHAVRVSKDTWHLLEQALEIGMLTQGGFNVAIGPAVEAWNVSREGRIPSQDELAGIRPFVNSSNVRLDQQKQTVHLTLGGMRIDVGGIGKGYAADLAAEAMKKAGATGGVVAISGDIKTFGRMPDGQKFLFGIQHPRKEQGHVLATIELENEAVSTAGDYQRYFIKDGVRYHHILDPETLHPARLCQSVTVIAREGVIADGLDTGIFVMGPERGMALVEHLPHVEAVIVDAGGKVFVSSGLRDRLIWLDTDGLSPLTRPEKSQAPHSAPG